MFLTKRACWISGLVVLIAAVFYCYNPFPLYFQNDDFVHIPLSAGGEVLQHNSFRPICDLSVMLDHSLWGKRAWGYHFTNLILHVISTTLVFILSLQILQQFFVSTNKKTIAVITALMFFVYPFHSEAVFWILGRSAILGTLFSLLFFIFYWKETTKSVLLSYLFFAIALLSYESSWVLPLFCWILLFIKKKKRKTFFQPTIISLLFFVYLCLRYFFTKEIIGDYEGVNFIHFNISELVINISKLLTRSFFPSFESSSLIFCFGVILLALVALFFRQSKSDRMKVVLLFIFFLLSLIPYASIGIAVYGTEAERFLYFPSVIVCFIISYIAFTSFSNATVRNMFLFFIFLSFSIALFHSAGNYRLAGNIVRTFVREVNRLNHKRILYLKQVPHSKNGALILRQGAIESVKWLGESDSVDSVIICSTNNEFAGSKKDYRIIYKNLLNTDNSCGAFNKNDAVFYFTDSALIVYK